jgi:hypothetical protein
MMFGQESRDISTDRVNYEQVSTPAFVGVVESIVDHKFYNGMLVRSGAFPRREHTG